jgi:hypothetical protein
MSSRYLLTGATVIGCRKIGMGKTTVLAGWVDIVACLVWGGNGRRSRGLRGAAMYYMYVGDCCVWSAEAERSRFS